MRKVFATWLAFCAIVLIVMPPLIQAVAAQISTPTPTPVRVILDVYHDGHVETVLPSPSPDVSTQPPTIPPVTMIPDTDTPVPTLTFTPSPTPTVGVCVGTVTNAGGLNVRSGPSTNDPVIDTLANGDQVVITGFYVIQTAVQEWASIQIESDGVSGWTAAYFYNGQRLLTWDDGATACLPPYVEISGPGAVVTPTPDTFAVGARTVPGAANFDEAYPILDSKGYDYGVSPYASMDYCLSALDAGGVCVFRPGAPDCPDLTTTSDPTFNAIMFADHAQWAADTLRGRDNAWIEPINECFGDFTDPVQAQWWGTWLKAYVDEAERRNFPPLALPGLQPGAGNQMMFEYLKPALIKLADMGGLFSMHDYTFHSQTGLCVCDVYEACRHILNRGLMLSEGIDIKITITEAARQSGNAPVDVQDMVCWITKAEAEGYIHSVWLWVGGFHQIFYNANLQGYYVPIADALPVRN